MTSRAPWDVARIVGFVGLLAWGMPAHAIMVTPASVGGGGNEPGLYASMNSLYGAGNWVQEDSKQYQTQSNPNTSYQVTFEGRYAQDAGTFGYIVNGAFTSVMSFTAGSGPQDMGGTVGASTAVIPAMEKWNFGYQNTTRGWLFSSDRTMNPDGLDHLIVFQITNMTNTFVLAWKDWWGGGDLDYNDAILQVAWNPALPVPEPATILLLGAACIGLFARRWKRS